MIDDFDGYFISIRIEISVEKILELFVYMALGELFAETSQEV